MPRSTYAGEKMDFLTSYKSSKDFDDALLLYQEATNAVFRKKTSESSMKSNERTKHKIDTETFHFSRIVFVCTHFGQPTQRGQGKKAHTKHTATGCEASFTVNYDYRDKMLKISKSVLEHNHPTTPETYSQEYRVKRLDVAQKHALKEIVQLQPRNENLMHMINSKYRKALTLSDIRHLKYQLKAGQITDDMTDLVVNLEGLQQHGEVKVVVSNNGNDTLLDIVAFATRPMIELFNKYPEMIYMDATFKNNKSGYPLYQIMVEDGRGKGRTVFYAFVRRETAEVLSSMVGIFCSFMGDAVSRMTHAMTDKDANEIAAIRQNLPHVNSMLCAFHVHKAMKAKVMKLQCEKGVKERLQQLAYVLVTTNDVATFREYLSKLESISDEFFSYLSAHWLNCVDSWAYHARLHSRLFFNDTNNKCEGENRRLREILNSNNTLSVAVRQLFLHSLTQQVEVTAASVVQSLSTVVFRDANPRWQGLYSMFTVYAVQLMVQDHSACPLPVVSHVNGVYDCSDPSGVVYSVSGRPLCCQCPFFCQTTLPCSHMLSVLSCTEELTHTHLFSDDNRWLKSYVGNEVCVPHVDSDVPVVAATVVGPEARHHRTEAVLCRLSHLLKGCGSVQFGERMSQIEAIVDAWESNRDCVVSDVVVGESGSVVGDVESGSVVGDVESGSVVGDVESGSVVGDVESGSVVGDVESGSVVGDVESGSVVGDVESGSVVGDVESGSVVGDVESGSVVGDVESGSVVGDVESGSVVGDVESGSVVGDVESGSVVGDVESGCVVGESVSGCVVGESANLSLSQVRQLNVKIPTVRKRGRPKELKTRSYKKAKRVRFNCNICYACLQEEVPRELCDDGVMDWVRCSRCPRWFHNVCVDIVPDSDCDVWICRFHLQ